MLPTKVSVGRGIAGGEVDNVWGILFIFFLLAIMKKTDRVIDIRTPAEVRRRHLGA